MGEGLGPALSDVGDFIDFPWEASPSQELLGVGWKKVRASRRTGVKGNWDWCVK